MSGPPNKPELPQPLAKYICGDHGDKLPIPPVAYLRSVTKDSDGEVKEHASSLGIEAIVWWEGNWQVWDDTDNGYPVVFVDPDAGVGLACTLGTVDHDWITSATLGYSEDVGTFTVVTSVKKHEFCSNLSKFSATNERPGFEKHVDDELEEFEDVSQFEEVLDSKTSKWFSLPDDTTVYGVNCVGGHDPWKILRNSSIEGFSTLPDRHSTVAETLGEPFNKTPPEERRAGVNTDKAAELRDLFGDMEGSS